MLILNNESDAERLILMKRKLYLLTETFPYGRGEKTFIIPELKELNKQFDVTIISHASKALCEDKENITKLPEDIKVVNIDIRLPFLKRIAYFFRFFVDKDGIRETGYILKEKKSVFARLYQSIGFYALARENYLEMKKAGVFNKEGNGIYYTFWYFYYTYSISKNREFSPDSKLVVRTHRFDLYDAAYKGGRQPFKEIMDPKIDRIYFVADQGKTYYLNKYKRDDSSKYTVSRLGTLDMRGEKIKEQNQNDMFRLVSCSSVIPLKRVDLIIRALALIDKPIIWEHFGTGVEYDHVLDLAKRMLHGKKNIIFRMNGYVPNEEVLKYYQKYTVDCFISTSSSEGLPVSIQEAMSFGIPIIATDVGGNRELFCENGILLSANPSEQEVADAISCICEMPEEERKILGRNSRNLWDGYYNAEQNSKRFAEELLKL